MDLADYRRSAEAFVTELTEAFYRHYAGLDDEYAIEPVHARHPELFGREAVEELRELAAAADGEASRRLTLLLDFAVEGYLGQATKELEAEIARREATATVPLDGETAGFRAAAAIEAQEPDPERRERIEQGRLRVIAEQLEPLQRELTERRRACARGLGYRSYAELCERCKGIDTGALQTQTDAFAAASEPAFETLLEPELRRMLGYGLDRLRHSDLPRFFRAAEEDPVFPADRLVPSLVETLRGLGIAEQPNVVLDVEPRPKKSPRAFCAPVRVPQEVYLVISPVGGRDDFSALFHEAGHTEHAAHVDAELPFEFRYLGDNSVTESFAFLLQHLVENPVWLERRLGVADPAELIAYARANRLVYLRRYTAKLAYERELHASEASLDAMPARYSELLGGALRIAWPREMYLADVDPGFYCACYLRAWALETHLRRHLCELHGPAWFDSPEAGATLRSLWRDGQRRRAEELLGELTGEELDFRVLLEDLGLGSA